MKTDRFDDEFRRKLLGLPADTDPGEVERVHAYVQTNLPGMPGSFWGKLGLYGGAGLLLVASLTYNFIQSYRNTHLQASLDSLAQESHLAEKQVKHDTVYITRSMSTKTNVDKSQPMRVTQPTRDELTEGLLTESPKRNPESTVVASEFVRRATPQADKSTRTPTLTSHRDATNTLFDSASVVDKPVSEAVTSVERAATRARNEATGRWRVARRKQIAGELTTKTIEATGGNSLSANRSKKVGETLSALLEPVSPLLGTNSVVSVSGTKQVKFPKARRPMRSEPVAPAEGITPIEPVTKRNRQPIEQLASRQLDKTTTNNKALAAYRVTMLPNTPTTVKKNHQRWHLALPTLAVPNALYRIGGGLIGGEDEQVGGSLLGEIVLNQHWSIQTGVRALYSQGFHYRDERDFNDHRQDDFRQKYASQLSLTSDIEDINLQSTVAQIPIQVAYHYPLSQQWRLRLGIGTDLDLWVRSNVNYKYQGTGRSSERGSASVEPSVSLFNNLTLTPSVEWYRKKWLFRAGPFISPQLRSVSYKPDDLSWGAHIQIFYQLGK